MLFSHASSPRQAIGTIAILLLGVAPALAPATARGRTPERSGPQAIQKPEWPRQTHTPCDETQARAPATHHGGEGLSHRTTRSCLGPGGQCSFVKVSGKQPSAC